MSSASASKPPETRAPFHDRLTLWPRSLFWRLFAAVLIGVFTAQAIGLFLVGRERDRTFVQAQVRESSRRILDLTASLQRMDPQERALARAHVEEWPLRHLRPGHPPRPPRSPPPPQLMIQPQPVPDFGVSLEQQLQFMLGSAYTVSVAPTGNPARPAMVLARPGAEAFERGGQRYDVSVGIPDGDNLLFRVEEGQRAAPLPRSLTVNLILLTMLTAIALYLVARSITQPLSKLARAAEAVGRDLRQPPLLEEGSRELRHAARAFNTMQERMHRYVDSRTRVLAAMSHDLKTPLTRMRLRVATLMDPDLQARFDRDLEEMEGMVRGALSVLRGLNDDETTEPVDIDALLATLQAEFAELGTRFEVHGRAHALYAGKPQALKRCLTNLISNAVNFGGGVGIFVEDGAALTIRVVDEGPGIPAELLQRVFEPFYRVESSRNRDTGGTGLGLCIARDIAQAHGGALTLQNLPRRGLEARLILPRSR